MRTDATRDNLSLVNQCLENPSRAEANSARENEHTVIAADAAVSVKGRVLLLEDDASLREIIRDFLAENGYTVVEAQNGGEGVREALASDFAMVLCDFMMPGLPGDMFYRAVEKIRPDLCKGFVFMTGYQNDLRTNEFIKSVNGFVLRKPFPLGHLLDSIALAEVRRTYQSVAYDDSADEGAPRRSRAEDRLAQGGITRPQAPAATVSIAHPAVEEAGKPARSLFGTSVWAVVVMAFAGIGAGRYSELRSRAAASAVELLVCEQQWASTSVQLDEAEGKRRGLALALQGTKRIAADYDAPALHLALRSIAAAAGTNVELGDIQVRGETDAPGAYHIRITGVCTGPEPRATADGFRKTLELKLKGFFTNDGEITRFERIEDAVASQAEPLDQPNQQAAFTIIATTAANALNVNERSGTR